MGTHEDQVRTELCGDFVDSFGGQGIGSNPRADLNRVPCRLRCGFLLSLERLRTTERSVARTSKVCNAHQLYTDSVFSRRLLGAPFGGPLTRPGHGHLYHTLGMRGQIRGDHDSSRRSLDRSIHQERRDLRGSDDPLRGAPEESVECASRTVSAQDDEVRTGLLRGCVYGLEGATDVKVEVGFQVVELRVLDVLNESGAVARDVGFVPWRLVASWRAVISLRKPRVLQGNHVDHVNLSTLRGDEVIRRLQCGVTRVAQISTNENRPEGRGWSGTVARVGGICLRSWTGRMHFDLGWAKALIRRTMGFRGD